MIFLLLFGLVLLCVCEFLAFFFLIINTILKKKIKSENIFSPGCHYHLTQLTLLLCLHSIHTYIHIYTNTYKHYAKHTDITDMHIFHISIIVHVLRWHLQKLEYFVFSETLLLNFRLFSAAKENGNVQNTEFNFKDEERKTTG